MMMTREQQQAFGEAMRKARNAKNMTINKLLLELARQDHGLIASETTVKRIECGGAFPTDSSVREDTIHKSRLRSVIAHVLGLPVSVVAPAAEPSLVEQASRSPKGAVAAVPKAAKAPVEAPAPKKAPAVAVRGKEGWGAARAARDANRAAGKPQGLAQTPKLVKFYTSLTTDHGFSLGAIRATLRQLTALGIPTDSVRGEIKQKFAHYIDTLDV